MPALEKLEFKLFAREPEWHEHRIFKRLNGAVNLHVFSENSPEVARMLKFRDHLRTNEVDKNLYAAAKRSLARKNWLSVQNYADAKTVIIEEILCRAQNAR
jgi:GrpB-like predicted nucleotidyltransferase (UPF0157 family)